MTAVATREIVHTIGIAALRAVQAPERIRTVLGSCVGVALYDRKSGVGGMAHVILPSSAEGAGDRGKFADTAIDDLLQMVLGAGADRARLCAKIAGGARMFGKDSQSDLGLRNVHAAQERLKHHRIPIVADDTAGTKGRKITLDPASGNLEVQIIGEQVRVI